MKITKKIISLFLAILMVMTAFPLSVFAEENTSGILASGPCGAEGDNLTWTLYNDGELLIDGKGEMRNIAEDHTYFPNIPWGSRREKITKVTISEGVTSIGSLAFYDCSLKSVSISNTVTSIGDSAFLGSNIKSVTIPNSVTTIGDEAFAACFGLENIIISNGVTYIGDGAFRDCNISNIFIPASVNHIGNGVFESNFSLKTITVDSNNINYMSDEYGVLHNKDGTIIIKCPRLDEANYIISNSVAIIGDCAFSNSCLTSIIIPDSVTTIGNYAFYNCWDLTKITIPNCVISIGDNAFYGCSELTSITIPNSVISIGDNAFCCCSNLESISIPDNASIGYGILKDTAYYKNSDNWDGYVLYVNNSLIAVEPPLYSKFSISIKEGTTVIADYALSCRKLISVTIPESVTIIGKCALSGSELSNVSIDPNNKYYVMDNYGVLFNKNKTTLIRFTEIYSEIEYVIPDSVTTICDKAFYYCTSLNSITIPDSVTSIGDYAFYDCKSLKNVYIGNGVTSIGDYAFAFCRSLTDVTIPDSVTSIGEDAFNDCESLESITIPDSVTTIGDSAFDHCESLKSITIPDSVTTISYNAFRYCTSLTNIIIPNSVKNIGVRAFENCTALTDVYYSGSKMEWKKITIEDNYCLLNANIHFNSHGPNDPLNDFEFTASDYTQTHTVADYDDYNEAFAAQYFSGTATPMDGTNGNPDYCIPGLQQGEEMIPQGIAYYEAKDWILISAYNEPKKKASVIYALDRTTGKYVAQFNVTTSGGNDSTAHLGGIAVSDNNLYLSYNKTDSNDKSLAAIGYIPLSDLNVEIGTVKDISVEGTTILTSQLGDATTSYVTISDGVLYTGNFYCANSSKYDTKASKSVSSVIVGYQLSGSDSTTEWNNIVADNPYRKYELFAGGEISEVQSAIVKDGYLYMSCSYGRENESTLYVKNVGDAAYLSIDRADFSCTALPMMENFCFIDGELYTLFESASYFYHAKSFEKKSKHPTDVVWKIDYEKLINKKTASYEGDVELTTVPYGKGSVDISFKQNWFSDNSLNYNHSLAQLSSQFAMLGYEQSDLKNALKTIGMDNIQIEAVAEKDKVDYFIANRPITVDGEDYTLLFTGFIGTNTVQWYSNFEPGLGDTHQSFNDAKTYVLKKLEAYVAEHQIDTSKTKILVCGHSRGAATANLVSAELIKTESLASKENIYTYAFATPNSNSLPDRNNYEYKRIFNIVNPEDFVTKVIPAQWGYGRYGTTYTLPSKTNTTFYSTYLSNMREYFSQFKVNEEYTPLKKGEKETYDIIKSFTKKIGSINDFYSKDLTYTVTEKITPDIFFSMSILPLIAEKNKSSETFTDAVLSFLYGLVNPLTDNTYTNFCEYFLNSAVLYEVNKLIEKEVIKTEESMDPNDETSEKIMQSLKIILGSTLNQMLESSENYFEDAHCAETYCAYMMSMNSHQLRTNRSGYENTVNCPVDIEVIDNTTGEVVARIVNNEIDEEIAAKDNALAVSVDGDSKSFWLPSDGDYEVKLTGNDNGIMDYSVEEINENSDEMYRVNFNEVEIIKDQTLTGTISTEDFILDEYALTDEAGESIANDDVITSDNIDDYTVNLTVDIEGVGNVSGDGTYTKSDYVTLLASTDEGNNFLGWYENDELLSEDASYSFVIKNEKNIVAKFTSNYICACGKTFDSEEELTTHTETCCKVTNEHSYTIIETVYPTCTEQGYTTYTCSCGDSYTDNYVDATGHNYETVVTAATCTEQGFTSYTCSCGDSYIDDYVDATGHNYETVVTAATCTEQGFTSYTCSCGDSYVDNYIDATGHNYEPVVTAATCTEQGYTTYTCSCGDSYVDNYIDATGHNYETVVTAATCTEQGFTSYTCSCGDSYTDNYVDATGHNYEAIVTEPTCTEPGITVYTCTVCADSYLGDTIAATGHVDTDEDEDEICDICGESLTTDDPGDAPTFNDNGIFKDGCAYTISPNGQILTNIPAGTTYGDIIVNSNAESMFVCVYDVIYPIDPNLNLTYADASEKEKNEYILSEFTTEIQTGDIIQLLDKDGNEIASFICEIENESYVDYDGDGFVTSDDAIFFLKYTMLPQMYIVKSCIDFDGDGYITSDDAIYLLKYTMLPDMYPIY